MRELVELQRKLQAAMRQLLRLKSQLLDPSRGSFGSEMAWKCMQMHRNKAHFDSKSSQDTTEAWATLSAKNSELAQQLQGQGSCSLEYLDQDGPRNASKRLDMPLLTAQKRWSPATRAASRS